jgi:hypothetical protein
MRAWYSVLKGAVAEASGRVAFRRVQKRVGEAVRTWKAPVPSAWVEELVGCSLGYGELEVDLAGSVPRPYSHEPKPCNLAESVACRRSPAETRALVCTWARRQLLSVRWPFGP